MICSNPTMYKNQTIRNLSELSKFARHIQAQLMPQTMILLTGALGTGKTTLVKKLLKLYGLEEKQVKSPTFSLINVYKTSKYKFYHLDLYRLDSHDQFLLEEIKEILAESNSIVLIEWPENMQLSELFGQAARLIDIKISFSEDDFRKFSHCVN